MTTDDEFLGEHLFYEVQMLQGTYLELQKAGYNHIVTNALIEAFCIHARQLVEFFNNKQGRHAKEFTGGSYEHTHLAPVDDVAKRLNTQIAHLTGRRTANAAQKIGSDERQRILIALQSELQCFVAQLEPKFRSIFSPPAPLVFVTTGGQPSATNSPTSVSS